MQKPIRKENISTYMLFAFNFELIFLLIVLCALYFIKHFFPILNQPAF